MYGELSEDLGVVTKQATRRSEFEKINFFKQEDISSAVFRPAPCNSDSRDRHQNQFRLT